MDGYDALEAAASSFAASADRTTKDHRSEDGHRSSRGGSERRDREDRHRERRDRDREAEREERPRDRDRERERERGDRGDRDRRHRVDEDDYRRRPRGGGDDYDDRRRRRYDDEAPPPPPGRRGDYPSPPRRRRSPPPMARGMRDDYDPRGPPPPRAYRDDPYGGDRRRDGGDRRRDGGRRNEPLPEDRPRSPTPPGEVPISERRKHITKWDIRPPGFEHIGAMQAKMTGAFGVPGPTRGNAPPGYSHPQPMALGADPMAGASMVAGANPIRQSKRLYVGNIAFDCSTAMLAEFFNGKMTEQGLAAQMPGDPIIDVQMNQEKSYAFVEFRTPEEATAAMAFDGIIFQGTPLKIRRPKEYAGPDQPAVSTHIPGVVSTTVPDTPNKIYIGSLPTYLNDEQVMELLKSFGELKAFNLVKEGNGQTGASKGFAFCEYVDPAVTDMAIQGLNGFQLADKTLSVQRAMTGRSQQQAYSASGANAGPMGAPSMPTLATLAPNILASAGDVAAAPKPTSKVMLMLNMVTADELRNDQDYEEIIEDVNDECSKYGEVEGVRIPRPVKREAKWNPGETAAEAKARADAADAEAGVGKVFVKFASLEAVEKALNGIAGRQFGGRTILCASVAEEEFLGPAPPPPPPADEA